MLKHIKKVESVLRSQSINTMLLLPAMFLLFLILSFQSLAKSPSREGDEVIVVLSEYRPYQYLDEGIPKGPKIKILSYLIKEIGLKPLFKFLPWKRALKHIETGEADLITAQKSPKREKYMQFVTDPLWKVDIVAVRRAGNIGHYNGDLSTLHNVNVGIVNGFNYGREFDENVKDGKFSSLTSTGSTTNLIRMLLADRVDVMISNKDVVLATANHLGVAQSIKIDEMPLQSSTSHIAISKKTPYSELHKRLTQRMIELKKEGLYQKALETAFSFETNN